MWIRCAQEMVLYLTFSRDLGPRLTPEPDLEVVICCDNKIKLKNRQPPPYGTRAYKFAQTTEILLEPADLESYSSN